MKLFEKPYPLQTGGKVLKYLKALIKMNVLDVIPAIL
jgi:hypothetical protein